MRRSSFCLLFLLIWFLGCNYSKSNSVYTAGLLLIPSRLDPWHNQINTNHFINLHVYYPMFSKSEGGNQLNSAFFRMENTHALNAKFDSYQFCLIPGVKFSDNTPITLDDLLFTLAEVHRTQEVLPALKALTRKDDCLVATLGASDSFYFDKLASVSSTLLKKVTIEAPVPVGLGPYKVLSMLADEIRLTAVMDPATFYFKQVIFKKVKNADEGRRLGILDLNHVYNGSLDALDSDDNIKVSKPILKSYSVVVSVPSYGLRHAFGKCFDRRAFAKATGISLDEAPGFLPRGILGAEVELSTIPSLGNDADSGGFARSQIENPSIALLHLIYLRAQPAIEGGGGRLMESDVYD